MYSKTDLLTLFALGTLSATLDVDVKFAGQFSFGSEELRFVLVLTLWVLIRR